MITYNDLYETLRKERYSEQLQPLSQKFILDVSAYIAEKKKLSNQGGDFFSDEVAKIKKQLENSNSIFKELMLLRKKKLLGLVFVASETGINKRDFENMLSFERELFDNIMSSMEHAEKSLLSEFSNTSFVPEEQTMKLVLFLDDVEGFLDTEGKDMGPFKKDDIVNLPRQIAEILVSDKKAEIVLED
jgi:DNA replication initiation complex subunit (GINS family)